MTLTIFTDGGSLNNPGEAASAFLIYSGDHLIYKEGKRIGIASNNVAEYTALINALTKVKELQNDPSMKKFDLINVFADSQLMVNQVNGLYKVKHADMRDKIMQIRILETAINIPIAYTHVLREKNAEADALVKEALSK